MASRILSTCSRLLVISIVAAPAAALAQSAIEGYQNYDALRVDLESIATHESATLSSIGETLGGRDIFLLTLSSGDADKKPAILVVGNVAAPHLAGSEFAVRVAKSIIDRAKTDERVKKLLAEQTIYIIPRPTPDASEAFFQAPLAERAGNVRVTDDDRDGDVNEDPNEDMNGDGLITMLRVADPNGAYMPHPEDPRVMIKADAAKNEKGSYRVLTEGVDSDKDEAWNEDGVGGVEFNRNFTFEYPYFERGAGPHQVSEPESRAVADFAFAHPNIYCVIAFAPQENLAKEWKPNPQSESSKKKTAVRDDDAPYFKAIAKEYGEAIDAKNFPDSADQNGAFVPWAYFHYGRWSFGTRGWAIPESKPEPKENNDSQDDANDKDESKKEETPPGDDAKTPPAENVGGDESKSARQDPKPKDDKKPEKDDRGEDEINALRWFEKMGVDGFVDWKPIPHPDFPGKTVEVGGFRPFLRINPPAAELDAIGAKHADFVIGVAEKKPSISIEVEKLEPLDGGVFRLKAIVRNDGFLPTMPAMGETSRWQTRLQAEIALPEGAKLIPGGQPSRVRMEPLAGAGGNAAVEWLFVVADDAKDNQVRLSAGSPAVGVTETTVDLP